MSTTARERRNWLLHMLYVRNEYDECVKLADEILRQCHGLVEYPLYIKGLVKRQQGQIAESLTLFQAATCLNPRNVVNLKQVARSLFLLGRHKAAVEVYSEAGRQIGGEDDWELHHNKGMCYVYLKQYAAAEEAFQTANAISRHDATYLQLGKLYAQRGDIKTALETYLEALEYSPDNPELLTTVGLLYMRLGQNFKAFEYLGNSLTHDPRSPKTILAVGSIIQDNGDMDVALVKYRVAAVQTPNSAQLWNNIGMCFFGKQKYVAAIACLKRALYLDPFEWIVSFNLGLVHLATEQYASAVHHLSASVSLKPDYGPAYAHLGTALAQLHDTANACSAFEKALTIEAAPDPAIHINYGFTLYSAGEIDKANVQFRLGAARILAIQSDGREVEPEVLEGRAALATLLAPPPAPATAASAPAAPATPQHQMGSAAALSAAMGGAGSVDLSASPPGGIGASTIDADPL